MTAHQPSVRPLQKSQSADSLPEGKWIFRVYIRIRSPALRNANALIFGFLTIRSQLKHNKPSSHSTQASMSFAPHQGSHTSSHRTVQPIKPYVIRHTLISPKLSSRLIGFPLEKFSSHYPSSTSWQHPNQHMQNVVGVYRDLAQQDTWYSEQAF